MKRVAILLGTLAITGCQQMESLPFERATRVALPAQEIEIDGKTYTVRRNQDTFPSGTVQIRWAIVNNGQVLSCSRPTVEACRDALKRNIADQSGMY